MLGKLVVLFLIPSNFFNVSGIATSIGKDVPVGSLPWQVILKRDQYDQLLCGGSIVSTQWVLTAGHCTYEQKSIFIVFGTNNLKKYTMTMTSTQFYLHPEYVPTTLNNDVSLIKLPSLLTFTDLIKPIQIVSVNDVSKSFVGTIALIAGHGYTEDYNLEFSEELRAALVVIIDNKICASKFGEDVVIDSTICAKGVYKNDSICGGDSGGPLVIRQQLTHKFIQIGINSFAAEDSCAEGYPSGYARLTSFLDYIQSTMDANS